MGCTCKENVSSRSVSIRPLGGSTYSLDLSIRLEPCRHKDTNEKALNRLIIANMLIKTDSSCHPSLSHCAMNTDCLSCTVVFQPTVTAMRSRFIIVLLSDETMNHDNEIRPSNGDCRLEYYCTAGIIPDMQCYYALHSS